MFRMTDSAPRLHRCVKGSVHLHVAVAAKVHDHDHDHDYDYAHASHRFTQATWMSTAIAQAIEMIGV